MIEDEGSDDEDANEAELTDNDASEPRRIGRFVSSRHWGRRRA